MKKWIEFLRSEYKVFLFLVYVFITFGGIFTMAGLKHQYLLLGIEIIFFGLFIYLVIQWINFNKEKTRQEIIEDLEVENSQLQSQIVSDRKDLEAYFLVWVHQIKTPLTVANLILRKEDSIDTRKLKEQMFYIEEYTHMAMNYLKLKDREADMDISYVHLDALIKPLLKKYSMLFIEKYISLDYQGVNKEVITDAQWLSVLVEQILANAIKYTEKGKISIFLNEDKNALVIKDTGIGIRSEDIHKIFDRGYSGFNGRINEKSSGLGLYLVKNIAEILSIKIEVVSELNEGSEFYICF